MGQIEDDFVRFAQTVAGSATAGVSYVQRREYGDVSSSEVCTVRSRHQRQIHVKVIARSAATTR